MLKTGDEEAAHSAPANSTSPIRPRPVRFHAGELDHLEPKRDVHAGVDTEGFVEMEGHAPKG